MTTFDLLLRKLKALSARRLRHLSRERTRRELARLPPHLADDLGLTNREASSPPA